MSVTLTTLPTRYSHIDEFLPVTVGDLQVRAGGMSCGRTSAARTMVLDLAVHGHVVYVHEDWTRGDDQEFRLLAAEASDPTDPTLGRISMLSTDRVKDVVTRVAEIAARGHQVSVVVDHPERLVTETGDDGVLNQLEVATTLLRLARAGHAVVVYAFAHSERGNHPRLSQIPQAPLVHAASGVLTMARSKATPTFGSWQVTKDPFERNVGSPVPMRFLGGDDPRPRWFQV